MRDNPYSDLGAKFFWRSAVASVHPMSLDELYLKKYNLEPDDVIATAGSCFAQHISQNLSANGFSFTDFEPAPPSFPTSSMLRYNYGVFSARFCNIYTVRQLLQLLLRAYDDWRPVEPYWQDDGVVDAFRPKVEPRPFVNVKDYERSLAGHLAAVRRMFESADIFIFTLGLTEAWIDKRDGSVYPLCPGTLAGRYDEEKYEFHNFTFNEVYNDFVRFMNKVQSVNPKIKFLLTVSPVPLTATASSDHVLIATMKSKSILRSVAGQLADEFDAVDYFPSYEIISSPSMGGIFFDKNMRTVNNFGVDYVMQHFFRAHPPACQSTDLKAEVDPIREPAENDVICEEALLEDMLWHS